MDVVQSFWFGSHLPTLQRLSLASFVAHGHGFHLYAFEPIDNVPEGVTVLDASAILPPNSVFTYQRGFGRGSASAFSNLFRYKLLSERGGWWVDTDVVCLRPFNLDSEFVFAGERDVHGHETAASCVIKSPAGAAWVRHCLDVAQARDKQTIEWGEIGPRLMNEAIAHFALRKFLVPADVFNPVDYKDFRTFQAPGFDPSRLSSSLAVHLWNQKWSTHSLDPDFDGAPDSLYAMLRSKYLASERLTDTAAALAAHLAFQERALEAMRLERERYEYEADVRAKEVTSLRDELQRHHDATDELRRTRDELQRSRDDVQALRNSMSWKITRPLRAIFDKVGGKPADRRGQS